MTKITEVVANLDVIANRTVLLLVAVTLYLHCLPCGAQVQTSNTPDVAVAQIFLDVPDRNRTSEFEQGLIKHIAWLKANHEVWTWLTWEVLTGKDSGKYIVGSFGHKWEDFDSHEAFNRTASVSFKQSVGPALSSSSCTFYVLRTDLSLSAEPSVPSKFEQLNIFDVRPEGAREFSQSIRKMNAALKQTNFVSESFLSPNSAGGHSRWYFMTNGGQGPQYVLATDRNSYSDFNPVEASLDDVMEQVYGKDQGDSIMANVRKTFVHVYSELVRFRPDLSYRPAAQP